MFYVQLCDCFGIWYILSSQQIFHIYTAHGHNEGGKESTMPQVLNHQGNAEKSQQCRKYFLKHMRYIYSQNTVGLKVENMGVPNLLLALGAI